MRKMRYAYFVIALVWLILTLLPIPTNLMNQVRIIKIALLLVLIFVSAREKGEK